MSSLVPLMPGEVSLVLERATPPRPMVVKVLLFVLLGPAVVLTVLAAPIAGFVTKSWLVALALLAGAVLTAGLGWLISSLSLRALAASAVHVELTSHRAITERQSVVTQTAWSDVVALSALRSAGVDLVGDVTWFDLAALVVDVALSASAEAKRPTAAAYWSGATGLVLKTRNGVVHTVPTSRAAAVGASLARALAGSRLPLRALP
jgi:hypothetical protein